MQVKVGLQAGFAASAHELSFMLLSLLLPIAMSLHPADDPALTKICTDAANAAVEKFGGEKGLQHDQIAISLARLNRKGSTYTMGGIRGDQNFYPASVPKFFYLVYVTEQLQAGKLKLTPELERGVRDMIVDSVNDATALVVDTITDTTGGPELPEKEFAEWQHKRNVVNRWLKAKGYDGINVNQKTWNEGPYGRERQSYGPKFENRNSLTTNTCVRLMTEIAFDKALPTISNPAPLTTGIAPAPSDWASWMKGFLSRKIPADSKEADVEARDFIGRALPSGSKLWSKAGYTSTVRHDVAWVQLPSGDEIVLAIFIRGHSRNEELLPWVAGRVLEGLKTD